MTGYEVVMSDTAVLVVDMLNAYRHEDAELLASNVADIIDPLVEVIAKARESDDVDLIYVNDNYGDFTADHNDIVRSALEGERPDLVKPIVPDEDCLFLEKVRHSAFYATSLAYLLRPAGNQTADPHRAGHRAMHPLHRTGRLHPPFSCRGAAGCGRAHRLCARQGGDEDDAEEHELPRSSQPPIAWADFRVGQQFARPHRARADKFP